MLYTPTAIRTIATRSDCIRDNLSKKTSEGISLLYSKHRLSLSQPRWSKSNNSLCRPTRNRVNIASIGCKWQHYEWYQCLSNLYNSSVIYKLYRRAWLLNTSCLLLHPIDGVNNAATEACDCMAARVVSLPKVGAAINFGTCARAPTPAAMPTSADRRCAVFLEFVTAPLCHRFSRLSLSHLPSSVVYRSPNNRCEYISVSYNIYTTQPKSLSHPGFLVETQLFKLISFSSWRMVRAEIFVGLSLNMLVSC